jgi:hypothetical protein
MGRACGTNGDRKNVCKVLVERREGMCNMEDTGVDGIIILKRVLKK